MSDIQPETKERSAEKRILSTVAKAMFRSAQNVQAGGETLSREQRKEATAKAWKENRKAYLKEAKRVVKQLSLSPDNVQLRPLKKKAAAATGE